MYDFMMNMIQEGDISDLRKSQKKLLEYVKSLEKRIEHLEKYAHQHHQKTEDVKDLR